MSAMKVPLVCLVGRTNVGKSALFNRIAQQKVKSLVFDKEHVTRDYIESTVTYNQKTFLFVDTGGLFTKDTHDALNELAKAKALEVIGRANVLCFVCDAKVGLLDQDRQLLKMLRKLNPNITLVINKVDNDLLKLEASEFLKLGVDPIFHTSAVHGSGISDLLDYVTSGIKPSVPKVIKDEEGDSVDNSDAPDFEQADDLLFKVAIVGKPNVGKSSLLNLLTQRDRAIVSDVEGTTREAISVVVGFNHQLIEITDTPGVRRQASVNESLEQLMVKSALASIRTSDITILMVDGTQGGFCNQELKLLDYALRCKKAVLVVVNKTDAMTEYHKVQMSYDLEEYDFMFKKVPLVKISCLDKTGLGKVRTHLDMLWQRCKTWIDTDEATNLVREFLSKRPLYKQKTLLKVFKVRFLKAKVPTFQVYVNDSKLFSETELGCLENVLRSHYNLKGCPVILRPVDI